MKRLILILALIPLTIACKKEGCTDPNAINYDSKAKKDQGCKYEGRAVIWYDQATSNEMTNVGIVSLTYYVDGAVVGSTSANTYWTGSPDCGANGSITITKDLDIAKNKSYIYSVVDENGDEWWSGIINFTANTCEATQLVW